MTNRSKLLSESACNKTLREEHCKASRNKYEKGKSYKNIQTFNAYIQHLEIIFGIYLTANYIS